MGGRHAWTPPARPPSPRQASRALEEPRAGAGTQACEGPPSLGDVCTCSGPRSLPRGSFRGQGPSWEGRAALLPTAWAPPGSRGWRGGWEPLAAGSHLASGAKEVVAWQGQGPVWNPLCPSSLLPLQLRGRGPSHLQPGRGARGRRERKRRRASKGAALRVVLSASIRAELPEDHTGELSVKGKDLSYRGPRFTYS